MPRKSTKPNGTATRTRTARLATKSTNGNGQSAPRAEPARIPVLKTYKIYIAGKFPRTESGRYYLLKNPDGQPIANICDCSRKDFRDAVVAARNAQASWASRSAYNRGQILYRIAEMLESRRAQFIEELSQTGQPAAAGGKQLQLCIDRILYYAGWADKYQQIFSSVNSVASSHFNFSVLEPTGVVAILAPQRPSLLGLISTVIPAICGGNTCVALASTDEPLTAVTFSEVLATSDLPGGVVNILTGRRSEILEHAASHMDVNAAIYCGDVAQELLTLRTNAATNIKRVVTYDRTDWSTDGAQSPYMILDTQEVKTTWHPIGV